MFGGGGGHGGNGNGVEGIGGKGYGEYKYPITLGFALLYYLVKFLSSGGGAYTYFLTGGYGGAAVSFCC